MRHRAAPARRLAPTSFEPELEKTSACNQAELANLIGSSRQWVTMQLSRLQKGGVIRYNRRMIVVRKLQALTRAT
ncbi:MAG TPA: helix-turn-helix domain-containing protein [Xanthobacteraceae bacterium]|nr:helix-turn-helix domain-containing protein [Xanthobacteraceae bacterium]